MGDGDEGAPLDRRQFLQVTGAAALLAALDAAGPLRLLYGQEQSGAGRVSIVGFQNRAGAEEVARRLEEAIGAVDDLSWLRPGDTVAIKVASNSGRPYPFTTHAPSLQALIRLLKRRGAGEVTVADQAGNEWVAPPMGGARTTNAVRTLWGGIHSGTSTGMEVLEKNGLARAAREAGAVVRSFDRESDWIHARELGLPRTDHWPDGFRVPALARDVKHVVNFARPSGHVMCGHTCTVKNWYGWLHPSDRMVSHTTFAKRTLGDVLRGKKAEVAALNECVAEVALAFRPKTRLNLVAAVDTYCDIGPDWGVQPLDRSAMFASKDMLAVDAAVAALLIAEKRRVPRDERKRNWRTSWKAQENERFMGMIEGEVHRMHRSRELDRLIDTPRHEGAWDIEQIRHARKIGVGAGKLDLVVSGAEGPTLGVIRDLTGGQVTSLPTSGLRGGVENPNGEGR